MISTSTVRSFREAFDISPKIHGFGCLLLVFAHFCRCFVADFRCFPLVPAHFVAVLSLTSAHAWPGEDLCVIETTNGLNNPEL